ncbi:MAG: PTS sugar transporter subunit IIA [Chromatiales bacterium 21-64-14]|nr:MAG: PTS sugar transporter subunit IIA [Chromatiales bacterium 21-64-14]HQU14948.1 PTS sugar transporter subunit IIA [Gammaproteobacteria bacterium]
MQITELITPGRVACNIKVGSKRRALELLGGLIASDLPDLTQPEVFESLVERERLGSTGMGRGVALPHGRLKDRPRAVGAFMKIEGGVDFDATDSAPVDLIFGLLVPEHSTNEHLQILARLATMFSDTELCASLRNCANRTQLVRHILDWESRH